MQPDFEPGSADWIWCTIKQVFSTATQSAVLRPVPESYFTNTMLGVWEDTSSDMDGKHFETFKATYWSNFVSAESNFLKIGAEKKTHIINQNK